MLLRSSSSNPSAGVAVEASSITVAGCGCAGVPVGDAFFCAMMSATVKRDSRDCSALLLPLLSTKGFEARRTITGAGDSEPVAPLFAPPLPAPRGDVLSKPAIAAEPPELRRSTLGPSTDNEDTSSTPLILMEPPAMPARRSGLSSDRLDARGLLLLL